MTRIGGIRWQTGAVADQKRGQAGRWPTGARQPLRPDYASARRRGGLLDVPERVILFTYYALRRTHDASREYQGAGHDPKEVREELGLEPGDEVVFEETAEGVALRKGPPTTAEGDDPFETYRGSAQSTDSMADRMRRLRGTYPRGDAQTETGVDSEESQ